MAGDFDTTQWSVVLAAACSDEPAAGDALARLCDAYWSPLYVFARRKGHAPDDARDLTQEFFAQLIEKRTLGGVVRERGRFRSFLLACFKHFLADQRDRARAAKRGGDRIFVPLDTAGLERQLPGALVDTVTPEALFERRWALALLHTTLDQVQSAHRAAGSERVFEALRGTLVGEGSASYHTIAAELGMSEGAVKLSAHRLRKRFGRALRAEVARTVEPEHVDEELRYLLSVLSS